MQITLEVPDEVATTLASPGQDPARAALEAIGLELYRQHRINDSQLRTLLGITSRYEFDGFLKEHQVEVRAKEEEGTPKQRLLNQILALRDSIEADKGVLSESYPLIRHDRER